MTAASKYTGFFVRIHVKHFVYILQFCGPNGPPQIEAERGPIRGYCASSL
jgi:hypothetical protein